MPLKFLSGVLNCSLTCTCTCYPTNTHTQQSGPSSRPQTSNSTPQLPDPLNESERFYVHPQRRGDLKTTEESSKQRPPSKVAKDKDVSNNLRSTRSRFRGSQGNRDNRTRKTVPSTEHSIVKQTDQSEPTT